MTSPEILAGKMTAYLRAQPDHSSAARSAYYSRAREAAMSAATGDEERTRANRNLVEAAILQTELGFAADNPRPRSATFAINVAAGCVFFAGVVDFLKPIVDLQTAGTALAALVVIAAWGGVIFFPAMASGFRRTRTFGLILLTALAGLFGIQSVVVEGSTNGALASSFPQIAALQDELRGLRADVREVKVAQDELVVKTEDVAERSLEIAEKSTAIQEDTTQIKVDTGTISTGVDEVNTKIADIQRRQDESTAQLRSLILNDTYFNVNALKNRWAVTDFGTGVVGGAVLTEDDGFDQAVVFAVKCEAAQIKFEFAMTGHGYIASDVIEDRRYAFSIDGEEYRTDWNYKGWVNGSFLAFTSHPAGDNSTVDEVAFILKKLSAGSFVRAYEKGTNDPEWREYGVFSLKGSKPVVDSVIAACPSYEPYFDGRM